MPEVTLLMLVTPYDIPIVKFTIPALRHLTDVIDVEIMIHMNGLSLAEESKIKLFAEGIKEVKFKSDRYRLESIRESIVPGESYITEVGRRELRVGLFDGCGDVWERELLLFNSRLVGIIDADFEIFDGGFIKEIIESFNNNPKIGFISVDYSPTENIYDTYSKQTCVVWERYHTWFCIYARKALQCYSDFSYFEEERNGMIIKYDHSAQLQLVLKNQFGYHGEVVRPIWQSAFLHYGAFSQNRKLKGKWLFIYRLIRIGRHNGWIHKHGQNWLACIFRIASTSIFKIFKLYNFDRERYVYPWAK